MTPSPPFTTPSRDLPAVPAATASSLINSLDLNCLWVITSRCDRRSESLRSLVRQSGHFLFVFLFFLRSLLSVPFLRRPVSQTPRASAAARRGRRERQYAKKKAPLSRMAVSTLLHPVFSKGHLDMTACGRWSSFRGAQMVRSRR